jgi:hypothetical protein
VSNRVTYGAREMCVRVWEDELCVRVWGGGVTPYVIRCGYCCCRTAQDASSMHESALVPPSKMMNHWSPAPPPEAHSAPGRGQSRK